MDKVRFAISGCGKIGATHVKAILDNPSTEFVAGCDMSISGKSVCDENGAQFYNDLSTLLTEADFDVLSVCTPNALHAPQAIEALNANRHVLVEKPMGLTSQECENIIESSLDKGKRVFCVMQNRYSGAARLLKQLIADKALGDIQMISIGCYWNRDARYYLNQDGSRHTWRGHSELDGGVLYTQFAHFIDLIYWLFGNIDVDHVSLQQNHDADMVDFPDSGIFSFKTEQSAIGVMSFSTATWEKNFENSVIIQGSEGTVKVVGQYLDKLDYLHIKQPDESYRKLLAVPKPGHSAVIQNVVDVLHQGHNVQTNAMDGLKVVKIIENIYEKAT
jgi:predicted dehydrogenase